MPQVQGRQLIEATARSHGVQTLPEAFALDAEAQGHAVALQAELGGSLGSLRWTTLGWGEAGGWSLDLSQVAPAVDLFKWLQPRRMTTVTRRWDTDRIDALQHAFFNGVGFNAWENVWGIWNGLTPRDAAALKRVQGLMRYLGAHGLSNSELWEPHTRDTAQPGAIFASRFPESLRWGAHAARTHTHTGGPAECGRWTAWTLVERSGRAWPAGTRVLEVDAADYEGCEFYDLYHGQRLAVPAPALGRVALEFAMEARGFGCVLAARPRGDEAERLERLLHTQRELTRVPLETLDSVWRPASQQQRPSPHPPPPRHARPPPGAVSVPASHGAYTFVCSGVVIEPFEQSQRDALGIDVRFSWEVLARNEHERDGVDVPSFFLDRAPVGNARYAEYLRSTHYAPKDARNFLREWPDWRRQQYPPGNATVPVTGVSFAEARAFCDWSGGRLPTTVEWQYAAQAGNASLTYPWGTDDDPARRPARVERGRTPAPADSDSLRAGTNPLGLVDLIGNVHQYTESEFADAHTRFVLLRGGSFYQPRAASDFQNWYFASEDAAARPGGAVRLDRHAKYFLFGAAYERAATVGFRCAYDRVADGATTRDGAGAGGVGEATCDGSCRGLLSVILVLLLMTLIARSPARRALLARFAERHRPGFSRGSTRRGRSAIVLSDAVDEEL